MADGLTIVGASGDDTGTWGPTDSIVPTVLSQSGLRPNTHHRDP
ncbi:MAG: hypothetical protein AVDCRST_MAG43-1532 [uncultured Thermomicrobiales bacterium]|uniref:Uncharacterized protein n=1 Tax=uncultured Thermomicrobiales bacterium TaxID=1645740 RepID=A0A6J4UUC9_9BACT|nr:MAG: hypothetical protein AVDCRST_MAG43-1532 [uncultured Thermomicrobiales bacterium]